MTDEIDTVGKALLLATAQLAAVSDTPRLDAELLLAHALGIDRTALLTGDHAVPPAFEALIARRMAHEPVAYITGTRDFWTITLHVAPGVLIPRPDSETLIEAAVAHFAGGEGPRRILDLGTGPGTLLLAALDQWPAASGVGIDASPTALAMAQGNAARIAGARAEIRQGDWASGIDERFDLILCNPPYVARDAVLMPDVARYEPKEALYAGRDGLDDYARIAPQLPAIIAPGGVACIEIGHDQRAAVTALLRAAGLTVGHRADLAGRDRCLIATHN